MAVLNINSSEQKYNNLSEIFDSPTKIIKNVNELLTNHQSDDYKSDDHKSDDFKSDDFKSDDYQSESPTSSQTSPINILPMPSDADNDLSTSITNMLGIDTIEQHFGTTSDPRRQRPREKHIPVTGYNAMGMQSCVIGCVIFILCSVVIKVISVLLKAILNNEYLFCPI